MAVRLEGKQILKRELIVLDLAYVATISAEGIVLKPKGGKLGVTASWLNIIAASQTPDSAPQSLVGKPHEFLKGQAAKMQRSLIKRIS